MVMDDDNKSAASKYVDDNGGIYKMLVRWLLGQEANTVALILIVGGMLYFAHIGVPVILAQLHKQYKEIAETQTEAIKTCKEINSESLERHEKLCNEIQARHEKQHEQIIKAFESASDRIQRIYEDSRRVSTK